MLLQLMYRYLKNSSSRVNSMPSTQKQLRDLDRLLRKYGSTEELLRRKEEILKQKDVSKRREKERKYSQKYHMVKFMERKKLIRKLKKAKKVIEEGDLSAQETVDKLYDDLTYVLYFPKDMKYMSILTDDSTLENKDNDKIEKLKLKARERARELRKLDIQEGHEDKVIHAIEVETNPNKVKRKRNNNDYSHDDNNDHSDDDNYDNSNDKSSNIHSKNSKVKPHYISEDNTLDAANDDNQLLKRHKTLSTSSSSSETTSSSSHMKNAIMGTSINKGDNENMKMKHTKEIHLNESNENEIETDKKKNDYDDDFFLTENDITDNDVNKQQIPQVKVNIGDLKRMKGSIANKKTTIENDGTLTKQELRLLNWQLKVRGKRKF